MWRQNFVLGVGVGMSKFKHTWGTGGLAAHTEFSRLLAEHGLFGLGAILVLLVLFLKNLACTENPSQRAITVVAVVWSSMFMTSNAMRLAAPSYMFGLSCITLVRVVAKRSPTPYRRLEPVGSGWQM